MTPGLGASTGPPQENSDGQYLNDSVQSYEQNNTHTLPLSLSQILEPEELTRSLLTTGWGMRWVV